jgi:hypothetical protein
MREGRFRCQTCLEQKLNDEAARQGCELIGAGRSARYRTYRLPCGHEQEVQLIHLRIGNFRCLTCMEQKLHDEAAENDCVLIGAGRNAFYRTYRLPCGHEQETQTGAIRKGQVRCQTCMQQKLRDEAAQQGCELVGAGRNHRCRLYLLPCGHEQEAQTGKMRKGIFRCQICEDYYYTQPSQAYLLHIKVGADEWLKLGYAKNVDNRVTRYGLPSDADVNVLATIPFDTGKEALEFEQSLHKKHKRKRLRAKDMLDFHTGGGSTECYPLTMVEKLMLEMKADS